MFHKKSGTQNGEITEKPRKKVRTASYVKRLSRQRTAARILRVALGVTLIVCVWVTDIGIALGLIQNANAGENWPSSFVNWGYLLIVGAVLLTAGTVLCYVRQNVAAMVCGVLGMAGCFAVMLRVTTYASESSFYSKVMNMSVDVLYRIEMLPTLVPFGCLLALAIVQVSGIPAREKRRRKKEEENAEAPSIL